MKVTFTTKQGFNQAQYIPKFLGSYNYATLYNEALANDSLPAKYSATDLYAYQNNTDPLYHPNVNWYNQVLRPSSYASNYDLTFSGGDQTVKYFVVLNAINSQGLYKKFGDMNDSSTNANYGRYNFRSNVDIALSKRLSVQFKLGGSIEQINNPSDYNTAAEFNLLASLPPNSFPVYNKNGTFAGNSTYANPVGNLIGTGYYQSNARTIMSSLKLTEQLDMITPGLSISGDISINNYFKSGSVKSRTYARYTPYLTPGGTDSTILVSGTALTSLSASEVTLDQYHNYIIQGYLNYHRTFGKSDITAMAMYNMDNIVFNGPTSAPSTPTANSTDPYKHNASAGRLTYVYNDKYIGEFSIGYMGSTEFAAGKRYGTFPAGSVGWIVSNENFLKQSKAVNFLKLRASYGLVGNDNTINPPGLSGRYPFTQAFSTNGYFLGTVNVGGYAQAAPANLNYTWEKERSTNIGLDATIFKHFDVSFDYFNRDRRDELVASNSTVPQFLGVVTPNLNQGKTNDKGFEASLRYNNNAKKGVLFFVEANVSYFKNKILFNAEALQLNKQLLATGTQIGQPFGYHAIGFYSQADIASRAANSKSVPGVLTEILRPGDIKYQDIGGPTGTPDGIIDANDATPIGHPSLPSWTVGLHTGLKYKGFDLDLMFQGVTGNTVTLSGNYFYAFQNNGQIAPIALGRWTPATAATATYPRLSSKNNLNNYVFSSFWQRDGSFVKLRSAEIGYTLPARMTQKIKINTTRFFLNGTNLFSLDRIKYGDPESLTGYPVTRILTLGAKISL
jgi:TonB-linked SusC/RagA family outer membrane protein